MSKLNILSKLSTLTWRIYFLANEFPDDEKYGLRSQMTRAMISVRLNIREGNTFRDNNKVRFFKIARGSLEEVDECLLIAKELDYITEVQFGIYRDQYWLCLNMLRKLISSVSSTKNGVD